MNMNSRRDFIKHSMVIAGVGLVTSPYASASVVNGQYLSLNKALLDAVIDFGCDNTGSQNTTKQLKAFYDACISNGSNGFIPSGIYLISEGELVFETPFIDKPWPNIFTAGHQFVYFKFAGVTDAPLITWSNGVADSQVGKYWIGGGHAGITFIGADTTTFSNSHAISMTGIWGFKFGWMKGEGLSGDLVYLPSKRYENNNPDPYACSYIEFEGLETNLALGKVVNNRNFLGLTHWKVRRLIASNGDSGVWYGFGTGLEIEAVSVGSCAGWAFEDSSSSTELDGPSSRLYINHAELDNVEFGFRINRLSMFELNGVRFVHRHNSGYNKSGQYWPRIAFAFADGKMASITCGRINSIHRIDAGGSKKDIGVFLSGNNDPGFSNCQIDQVVLDQPNFGFTDSDLYTNINPASSVLLTESGRIIYDMREKTVIVVHGSEKYTEIGFGGYVSLSSKVSFAQVSTVNVQQTARYYDDQTSIFTVPYRGMYQIDVSIPLILPIGTMVKIGIANHYRLLAGITDYARVKSIQYYHFRSTLQLQANDKVFVVAVQSTSVKMNASVKYSDEEINFTIIAL